MDNSLEQKIEQSAQILVNSRFAVALSGAGMSAESGIPTFRGNEGLWKEFSAKELATPEAFLKNSKLVWQWYNMRKEKISKAKPNAGHYALAKIQEIIPLHLITQNVDNLHNDAGSKNTIEIHGNIFLARCLQCGHVSELKSYDNDEPLCPVCFEGKLRPHIVWFGEQLDQKNLQRVFTWLDSCDTMLVIGTSSQVYPAAGFASDVQANGGTVIEINPQPAAQAHITLNGTSGEILPPLLKAIERNKNSLEHN